MLKTSLLNVFDLVHGILFYFSPHELFLKEVKDHKVETPKIVSSGQVDVMMSIKTCEAYSASKVSFRSLLDWVFVVVQMLLGKAEVDNENLFEVLREDEVTSFDISVNKASIVYLLNGL